MHVSGHGNAKRTGLNADENSPEVEVSVQQVTNEGSYMYVPPFDTLLKAIGLTRAEFEDFDPDRGPHGAYQASVAGDGREQRFQRDRVSTGQS